MAIYHFSAKPISRAAGRSATGAAAYRAGVSITDERTGLVHDYTRKGGVLHSELILPGGGTADRSEFWNRIESHHRRGDAVLAREVEISLPSELSDAQRRTLALGFARELADRYSVAADVALHSPRTISKESLEKNPDRHHETNPETGRHHNGNWHAHILLSACHVQPDGALGKKAVELDPIHCQRAEAKRKKDVESGKSEDKDPIMNFVEMERTRWSQLANESLERFGHSARIDHRSLKDQHIDREPTAHLGPIASAIERRIEAPSRKRLNLESEISERLAKAAEAGGLERQNQEIEKSILILSGDIAAARSEAKIESQRVQIVALNRRVKNMETGLDVHKELGAIGLSKRTDDPKKWAVPDALHEAFDTLADSVKAARAERENQKLRNQAQIEAERSESIRFFLDGVDYRDPQSFERNLERIRKGARKPDFSEIVAVQKRGWEHYDRTTTDEGRRSWLDDPEGLEKRERYWADRVESTSSWLSFWRKEEATEAAEALQSVRTVIRERNAAGQAFVRAFEQERKAASEHFEKAQPYLEEAREAFIQKAADLAEYDRRAEQRRMERERVSIDARPAREEPKPEVSKKEHEPGIDLDDGMDFGL